MKSILAHAAACFALMACHSCAQAGPQPDDYAFARNDKGETLSLSQQPCPGPGASFHWWHRDTPEGKLMETGCWTFATHRRIAIISGDGKRTDYIPYARFSSNPAYGE